MRENTTRALAAAVLLGLSTAGLSAQDPDPLVTDRPDRTESAAVVRPGLVQFEGGLGFSTSDAGEGDVHELGVGEMLARVGIVGRLELRAGFSGWRVRDRDAASAGPGGAARVRGDDPAGPGDTSLGAKLLVARGRGVLPDLAVLGTLSLPTGEAPFTSDGVDPSARLAAGHALPGGFSVGYNLGAEWRTVEERGGEERVSEGIYTLAVSRGLSPRVSVFAEAFGSVPLDGGTEGRAALDGGITVLIRGNLQWDLSGGVGVDPDADDWFLGTGMSVRLPR